MSYSKVIPIGSEGALTLSEAGGVATLEISLAEKAGGGDVAGFLSAVASVGVKISAIQLMDAGLGLAAAKFPSLAAEIALVQAAIDAEVKTL